MPSSSATSGTFSIKFVVDQILRQGGRSEDDLLKLSAAGVATITETVAAVTGLIGSELAVTRFVDEGTRFEDDGGVYIILTVSFTTSNHESFAHNSIALYQTVSSILTASQADSSAAGFQAVWQRFAASHHSEFQGSFVRSLLVSSLAESTHDDAPNNISPVMSDGVAAHAAAVSQQGVTSRLRSRTSIYSNDGARIVVETFYDQPIV
jgi:hypothetical protein